MERTEVNELLAGYLENELSAPDRERFEAMLAADAGLAAEASSLRHALAELRSLEDPASALAATPSVRADAPRGRVDRRGWGVLVTGLRYAAVIAVAFIAGFAARSARVATQPGTSQDSAPTSLQSNAALPDMTALDDATAARLAAAYNNSRVEPGLARSLVTLSMAMRTPPPATARDKGR